MSRRRLAGTLATLLLATFAGGASFFAWAVADLPAWQSFADYAPMQRSQVFAADGAPVGEYFIERRTVVPFDDLPPHVVHAFLAAEDAGFYHHEGIDYWGIVRALVKNMRPGAHLQGASTITQQTVKTLVLGPQRSYLRKLREAYLARQMEQVLQKNDILALYLNQIYFGSGAMGVEVAAQTYFGRSVRELDLGEAALLAAIPKNPGRYTLRADPQAAKLRQAYVLDQMQAHGWATAAAVAQHKAKAPPLPPPPPPTFGMAPYYLEHVRRLLVERLGERLLLQGGLRIRLAMDSRLQQAAQIALRQSLEEVAMRLGDWRPAGQLAPATLARLRQQHRGNAQTPSLDEARIWNLLPGDDDAPAAWQRRLGSLRLQTFARPFAALLPPAKAGGPWRADLGGQIAALPAADVAWAAHGGRLPFAAGDVAQVEVRRLARGKQPAQVHLLPSLQVQGALVALTPGTRRAVAMVGGLPAESGGSNRATQAWRQPGSVLKPVLYAAALQARLITPASLCNDAPLSIVDPWTGRSWRPENYESGRYDGNMTYRQALARSKNVCSVRLIQRLGVQPVIDMAHALGIAERLPNSLTLALGTGETTVLEMCQAYATLAAGGQVRPVQWVESVHANDGRLLFAAGSDLPPQTALARAVAYVLTHMLEGVVQDGTGARAKQLGRPLAGKTGTSQQSRDLWFGGYAPQLAAVVWMGRDDNGSVGRLTGASGALPAWIRFMGMALANEAPQAFIRPPGVRSLRIDPQSGLPSDGPLGLVEDFVAGTEPNAAAQPGSAYLQD